MGRMLDTVAQIGIPSYDLARSVEFYRDKLQIRLLLEAPNMAFFDCGGVRLMIGLRVPGPQQDTIANQATIYFKVDDIHAAAADLRSRGVHMERDPHLVARMPDHDLWMAFFRDPDGNALALMGRVS